jgi:uncharacterized protein (DUF2141 family)
MKKRLLTLSVVLLSTLPYLNSASIHVTITNVKEPKGEVIIYLYKGSEGFMNPDNVHETVKIEASDYREGHTFNNLETGEYVVILHHDKDRDGKMKSILGIPREGFGFSRNYRPKTRAPKFNEVKLTVEGETAIEIKMIYF